jgi:glycosyltransferase involved in cell wall biosynthesis
MEDIKISVIIPIYNVEKYLHQCVDSVLNQTYKNIEVILVDDGSPDSCPQICDEYAMIDKRIKVVHKENGGLSSARNAGLNIATGVYGIYIDSDDYWKIDNGLEILVKRIIRTKADILSFGYEKYNEDSNLKIPYFGKNIDYRFIKENKEKQLEQLIGNNLYIASACNKIIKLDLLRETLFVPGVVAEDVEWCAKLLSKAESFDFINLNFYCYRQRKGSISQTLSDKSCSDLCSAVLGCINIADESSEDIRRYIFGYTAYQFSSFIAVQAFTKSFQVKCINTLTKYTYVLKFYGNNRKIKYMYIGTKIFGLKNWCAIIRLTRKVWDRMR